MAIPALSGSASNVAPVLAPNKADWSVNVEAKTSTATVLTGLATISRRADGKFRCEFVLTNDEGEVALRQTFPLADCDTLVLAQQRAETLIRETLSKTRPDLLNELEKTEQQAKVAEAGPDPF